jgi:putative NADPH-quinone reductase
MSRVVVVHCHPMEGSLTAAVRDAAMAALGRPGLTVDLIDLHADGFDPVRPDPTMVADHRARLASADALVLTYPTWWSAQPAMLQGWVEAVVPRAILGERPMPRVRRMLAITSHGSPKWLNALEGEAGKRLVTRYLRRAAHPGCRTGWVALYGLDRIGEDARCRHLRRVMRRVSRLAAVLGTSPN